MTVELCDIPLEVLLIILQHAPDLPSIYKFICASTRVNTAFELDSARILDDAIERSIPDFNYLARMIAILGTFSSSSYPTYRGFLHEFQKLPKDVLTTAPASFAFPPRTPGIRYLLLTAYRIETLQHLCIVTLLENIHVLMWSNPSQSSRHLKRSRNGAPFQGAAWYAPSWVERTRIERALWKLVIYWNICTIYQDLREDDYDFHRYSAKVRCIDARIGPIRGNLKCYQYENEEIRCVLSTTQELLGCTTRSFKKLTAFARQGHPKLCIKTGASLTNFSETLQWKFHSPRPRPDKQGYKGLYYGQERQCVFDTNTTFRSEYWSIWQKKATSAFKSHEIWFPDYLGLCIWDLKRLSYLGLATVYDKRLSISEIDANKRTPCNASFDCGGLIPERWRAVFLHELARSLGAQRGQFPEKYNTLINAWDTTRLNGGFIVDGLRLYVLRLIRRQ